MIFLQLQLTFEQHGFELHRFTYTHIFKIDKYYDTMISKVGCVR